MATTDPAQILCYGDSNTWGLEALTFARFGATVRWPGVLAANMMDDGNYKVLEEGLSGRTTVWDDPLCSWLPPNDDPSVCNGRKSLMPILHSAKPVVAVVIALGVNDLKARFNLTPADIASGVGMIVEKVQQAQAGPDSSCPAILIICPPPCTNETFFPDIAGGIHKSLLLPAEYERVAKEKGCDVLDAGSVPGVVCSEEDGVHLSKEAHAKLGVAIAEKLKVLLRPRGDGLRKT
mmetsp:Transcript_30579/g.50496  ORF Transcript_30579/g.50496 Transcript_30579/m.50496 type:complete len:235 (+) Transcript_30579:28-732(+)|eukprot:CAMPEP_0119015614 /NCGR_PEP_ID=MMETSP1176-20130426/11310_1 /TAXON_ID=265551 /ORGANISM="Synedropsis recta cf, Strain CCMP1620" /LENGTH=234 /DNA_ID=CAMNT_0006968921 /DNA_START=24 /DNA_END=728 /DNA_ORIENTATION=+